MNSITSYCIEHNLPLLAEMVKHGLKVDECDTHGHTALMREALRDEPREEVVTALLESGADANFTETKSFNTPLIALVSKTSGDETTQRRMALRLAENGAKVTQENAEGMCAADYMSKEFLYCFLKECPVAVDFEQRKKKVIDTVLHDHDYATRHVPFIHTLLNRPDLAHEYRFSKGELLYLAYSLREYKTLNMFVGIYTIDLNEVMPNGKTLFDTILDDDQKEALSEMDADELFVDCVDTLLYLAEHEYSPTGTDYAHAEIIDNVVRYTLHLGNDTYARDIILPRNSDDIDIDSMTREEKLALIKRLFDSL